ncbi:MAG: Holliday junction resolvase RuvX [Bacteroidetes bacterium]|jgi:putative Holliday junction resolvase|nr:Holliday junction resolvase RuvX [Bacteroidota bacterium]
MSRIIAVDYGTKRVGIAVTDPLQMIATPLTSVHARDAVKFILEYMESEKTECIVIGKPMQMNNTESESEKQIRVFIQTLKNQKPDIKIERYDERFTSVMAQQALHTAGESKRMRKDKSVIDRTSAVIILQSYLLYRNNQIKHS